MLPPCDISLLQRAIDKLSRHHIRHIKAYDPHEGKVRETSSSLQEYIF